jgi:hypothetical protein
MHVPPGIFLTACEKHPFMLFSFHPCFLSFLPFLFSLPEKACGPAGRQRPHALLHLYIFYRSLFFSDLFKEDPAGRKTSEHLGKDISALHQGSPCETLSLIGKGISTAEGLPAHQLIVRFGKKTS